MNPYPLLWPTAFTLEDRPHFHVSKTPEGRWRIDGELQDHCCPVRAALTYLKHKGNCVCTAAAERGAQLAAKTHNAKTHNTKEEPR